MLRSKKQGRQGKPVALFDYSSCSLVILFFVVGIAPWKLDALVQAQNEVYYQRWQLPPEGRSGLCTAGICLFSVGNKKSPDRANAQSGVIFIYFS